MFNIKHLLKIIYIIKEQIFAFYLSYNRKLKNLWPQLRTSIGPAGDIYGFQSAAGIFLKKLIFI